VQALQSLQKAFTDVREDRGGRLTSADELGLVKIDSRDFGECAAEIDQDCKRFHKGIF
jgi:hypothetical protein